MELFPLEGLSRIDLICTQVIPSTGTPFNRPYVNGESCPVAGVTNESESEGENFQLLQNVITSTIKHTRNATRPMPHITSITPLRWKATVR